MANAAVLGTYELKMRRQRKESERLIAKYISKNNELKMKLQWAE
jgi:hypothetical protein